MFWDTLCKPNSDVKDTFASIFAYGEDASRMDLKDDTFMKLGDNTPGRNLLTYFNKNKEVQQDLKDVNATSNLFGKSYSDNRQDCSQSLLNNAEVYQDDVLSSVDQAPIDRKPIFKPLPSLAYATGQSFANQSKRGNIDLKVECRLKNEHQSALSAQESKDMRSTASSCSAGMQRYQREEKLDIKGLLSEKSQDSWNDQDSSCEFNMFRLDNTQELMVDYSCNYFAAADNSCMDILSEYSVSCQNIWSPDQPLSKCDFSYNEELSCQDNFSWGPPLAELDQLLRKTKKFPGAEKDLEVKDSNICKDLELDHEFTHKEKETKPSRFINLDDEFHDALFDICSNKVKKFTDLSQCKNRRAWEVIQKNSNQLHKEPQKVLDQIMKAKRNQNWGGERMRGSKIYTASRICNMERDTIPSSQCSQASNTTGDTVTKVYPFKLNQKIIRILRKHYKNLFEKYLKQNNVVFNRAAKNMKKEKFDDFLLSMMDELFVDHLDALDENTVESLMTSLSTIVLKERYKKKEDIVKDLDFTELNELLSNTTSKRTMLYFSKKENAFLYIYFFLLECKQLVAKPSDSCWCKNSTQVDEALVLFYQMHELYNEVIPFAPTECQAAINNAVNKYLKDIVL